MVIILTSQSSNKLINGVSTSEVETNISVNDHGGETLYFSDISDYILFHIDYINFEYKIQSTESHQ